MKSLKIKEATSKGYAEAVDGDGLDIQYPHSNSRRGRVQKQMSHTITGDGNRYMLEWGGVTIWKKIRHFAFAS